MGTWYVTDTTNFVSLVVAVIIHHHIVSNSASGVLLYFMVCGWLPFRAATEFDVYQKIKKGDYRALPSNISSHLKDLIKQMFTVDPKARPTISMCHTFRFSMFHLPCLINFGLRSDSTTRMVYQATLAYSRRVQYHRPCYRNEISL